MLYISMGYHGMCENIKIHFTQSSKSFFVTHRIKKKRSGVCASLLKPHNDDFYFRLFCFLDELVMPVTEHTHALHM